VHNVGFRPREDHPEYIAAHDRVRSDVDVVGLLPRKSGVDRVLVVSCKAWQAGVGATGKVAELRGEKANPKRATWRHFPELRVAKWSEAFRATITKLTGEEIFRYRVAVTRLRGAAQAWTTVPHRRPAMVGCSVGPHVRCRRRCLRS
jgi:hypothetical protein